MKGLPTNTLFYRKPTNLFLSRRSQNIQKSNYSAMQIDTRFFSTSVKGLYGISFMFHSYPARIYLFDL